MTRKKDSDVFDDCNCCYIVFLVNAQLHLLESAWGEAQMVRNEGKQGASN